MQTSTADLWERIAGEASRESDLWTAALRPPEEQERQPVFSQLGEERYALGIETIYEGYLLHYGRPRLFAPEDGDTALLLGDYLYAHGLVRIEQSGTVDAVNDRTALVVLQGRVTDAVSMLNDLRDAGEEDDRGVHEYAYQPRKKSCSRCLQWKDPSEFYRARHTFDGRQGWCRDCMRENNRRWRAERRRRSSLPSA